MVDNYQYPFDHPISGFGIYCVRCHASTQTKGATNEYTFASLRNIAGFPGEPLLFRVDDSWRKVTEHEEPVGAEIPVDESNEGLLVGVEKLVADTSHPRCSNSPHPELCQPTLNQEFLKLFPSIATRSREEVLHFPPETHDWVVRRPAPAQQNQPFVTVQSMHELPCGTDGTVWSDDVCSHGRECRIRFGGSASFPYGEWRWTPMGLAGRDPIFHAQLESEIELMRSDFRRRSSKQAQGARRQSGRNLSHLPRGDGQAPVHARSRQLGWAFWHRTRHAEVD